VKRAHVEAFEYVSVPDPLLSTDVNTPEQYDSLAKQKSGN
jgi:hypothetical protein